MMMIFLPLDVMTVNVVPVEEGVATAGDRYTLQCNITRDADWPPSPSTFMEVMWSDASHTTITSGTAYTISAVSSTNNITLASTLTFPRLITSQGGLYSCAANITIPGVALDFQVIKSVPVQVASELRIYPYFGFLIIGLTLVCRFSTHNNNYHKLFS